MNICIVPGIQAKTEKWANQLAGEITGPDRTCHLHRYQHWDCAGGECLGVGDEVERLRGREADLVIGLSLGVMVGIEACLQGVLTPQKLVAIGTPLVNFREKGLDLKAMVAKLAIPCLFIQQKSDIVGPFARLQAEIAEIPNLRLMEIPGDNHQYKDIKLLARHLLKFL